MIVKSIKARRFASNCYVVGSEADRQGVIIDPADCEATLTLAHDLGLTISLLVATHTHIDHIFAVRSIKEETGAEFVVHEAEGPVNMQALPE